MRYLFLILTMFCFTQSQIIGNEVSSLSKERKIYLKPNQIHIQEWGMTAEIDGLKMIVYQLNQDEDGLYVYMDKIGPAHCGFGHDVWCWQCMGCVVRYCKGRCKCVAWE